MRRDRPNKWWWNAAGIILAQNHFLMIPPYHSVNPQCWLTRWRESRAGAGLRKDTI